VQLAASSSSILGVCIIIWSSSNCDYGGGADGDGGDGDGGDGDGGDGDSDDGNDDGT